MLASHRILIELSEVRQEINSFPDDGERAKLDELTEKHQGLESRYRAEIIKESEADEVAAAGGSLSPERAEIRRLVERASISDFLAETEGGTLSGASLELRKAVLGDDADRGWMPLELLQEVRADAVTNISGANQSSQQPIWPRIFAQSALSYLGVMQPSVPVGQTSFPTLTGGTTAGIRSEGVELDGTAASITNKPINPVRLTASYNYGIETLQRVSGFEEALRQDVESVLMNQFDYLGLNGAAVVNNVSPAFEGFFTAIAEPDPAPTVIATATDYLDAYDDAVDGKYAFSSDQVRVLVGADVYKHAYKQSVTANVLLRDYLPAERFRVSANLPAAVSEVGQTLSFAAGAPARGLVMPIWSGVQLISDPFTGAKKGQRMLTAIMFVGSALSDSSPYKRVAFKIA